MQTFLPYADFERSAEVLDLRRLGKQIIEARQIGKALADPEYGWQHHPAVNMWRGHRGALYMYAFALNCEWVYRRGKSHGAFTNMFDDYVAVTPADEEWERPAWLGEEAVHASHRSNLLRKDIDHYGVFEWAETPGLEYVWPRP